MWQIPLSDLDIGREEIEAVTGVLESKWLTMGAVTQRFEAAFAQFIGVRHAFALSNGTAALQLAYRVIGLQPGDEVIMPALTFVATANAAVVEGGVPVFADIVGEDDLTIAPDAIRAKLTPKTRAITVVHYGGHPCQMEPILAIAKAHGLYVIEDCAHSPGASDGGQQTGTLGDVGCFSFFSNKNMTTGEGGMITTNRDDLATPIRLLRSHGMTSLTLERHKGHTFHYDVLDAGYNLRLDEMRAALGLVQLGKLAAANARRAALVTAYRASFAAIPTVTLPFAHRWEGSVFHIMPILLPPGKDRAVFMAAIRDAGVQTSVHYPPIHQFDFYKRRFGPPPVLPVTDRLHGRLVTLPLYPGMDEADVQRVVAAVQHSLEVAA